ncbi:MAG: hypothetical protein SGJ00_09955 [bacterium]|nr:hypothetical protein [bacterium]
MLLSILLLAYGLILTFLIGKFSWNYLLKVFHISAGEPFHIALFPVIGLASMSVFIGIYHFFFKIDFALHLFFLSWVVAAHQSSKIWLLEAWFELKKNKWVYLLLLFGAVLSITVRPGVGDIADYHLQAIKWAENYPNILGLGNFNRPLANNNWWFNMQSFLGFSWLGVPSIYVGNALFFISLFSWFYFSEPISVGHQWMRFFFAAFIILSLKTAFVGAVTPDIIVTLMIYLSIDLFIIGSNRKELQKPLYILMILLLSWVLTVKATAIVFFMLPFWWFMQWVRQKEYALIGKSILLALVFLLPWIVGNVLICGYILYPFNGIDLFVVDWKVPGYYFEFDKVVLNSWGKVPNQDIFVTQKMGIQEWMPIWILNLDLLNKSLVFGFLLSLPIVWFFMLKKREAIWPILFIQLSFLIIFLNGPHPRFLFGYMVSNLAFVFYFLAPKIKFAVPKIMLPSLGILLTLLLLFKLFTNGNFSKSLLVPKAYPNEKLAIENRGSFQFYVSKQTNLCWDKFPSTYYFIDSVELRGTHVKDGFKVGTPSLNK